jgi:hypothetical protein
MATSEIRVNGYRIQAPKGFNVATESAILELGRYEIIYERTYPRAITVDLRKDDLPSSFGRPMFYRRHDAEATR